MNIRGCIVAGSRVFAVFGPKFVEVESDGNLIVRGLLPEQETRVSMDYGRNQVFVADGLSGYVFNLAMNFFQQVTDPDFPGATMVAELDGFFVTSTPGTDQFNTSSVDDGLTWDALDFATAESRPDKIVAHVVINREVIFFGELTTEWWFVGGGTFALDRRTVSAVGCVAPWSVKRADNTVLMIGRDEHGSGLVYQIAGYQAKRVSTFALEAELQASTDISAASAFVFQWHGETFYCLQVPGLTKTPVYQLSTGSWFDLADLDSDGQFKAFRAVDYFYAFGAHILLSQDGKMWRLSDSVNKYGDDRRVCERVSPHSAGRMREIVKYSEFVADVTTGEASEAGEEQFVELSWSNDGGRTFGDPVLRSIGEIGERLDPPRWRRLGQARDRVWRLRFSGNSPFAIISGEAS
jgi:Phage stabilisation protein